MISRSKSMTTFYVINAVRGEWLEVQAPGVLEARRESYKANPEWMGEWITTTTGEPPSPEEIRDLMEWRPENE
jgi:hypothetical protein